MVFAAGFQSCPVDPGISGFSFVLVYIGNHDAGAFPVHFFREAVAEALGNEALRTSAREFRREVIQVQGSIAEYLARNNRSGSERSLERLYKEAWRKQHER